MAEADTLHVRKRRNQRHKHFLNLFRSPEQVGLLALPEDIFQVLPLLNVLTNDAYTVRIVHGFIEEVAVELNDVLMILSFEKLHCFLLLK